MREIGRYRVEHEIGRGGMAVVHLAWQPDLDRPVALKELVNLQADPARFLSEARIAGSLNHPNIVVVHEYFEHDGTPYIAMEYLARGSLRPLVGSLTPAQIVGVLDAILAGIAYAGEHGVVHRDLKPENVMRTEDGSVKIADFGIAKAQDELSNLTPAGEFLGAAAYVSPEQALGGKATAASDLYSVGVLAFELFTSAVPFADAGSGTAMLIRKVNEVPPSVHERAPEIDKQLSDWVASLLQREPARRPAGAAAARALLDAAAERTLGADWRRRAGLPADVPVRVGAVAPTEAAPLTVAAALLRPMNVAVGVVLAVTAALLATWLFAVAVGAYLALAAVSYFERRR